MKAMPLGKSTKRERNRKMINALKYSIIAFAMGWALMWGYDTFHTPTFAERFQPAIDHPLKLMSYARDGFCFPHKCRVV